MFPLKQLAVVAAVSLALAATTALSARADDSRDRNRGGGGAPTVHAAPVTPHAPAMQQRLPNPGQPAPRGPSGQGFNRNYTPNQGQTFNRGQTPNRGTGFSGNAAATRGFDRDRQVPRGGQVHDFRGRDFAHFTPAERTTWSHGGWHHDWHNGRYGWWWAVGGVWYFYSEPVYPYPTYVADTVWIEPDVEPMPAAAPGYWYYCSANGMYYPYTPTCPVPWTPVAPQPGE